MEKRGPGKPTDYREDFPEKAQVMASEGLTRAQIANNLGISTVTMRGYQNKYPSFILAVEKGEELAISKVENALFKKCEGYNQIEKTVYESTSKNGKKIERTETHIKKIAGDTIAQIFYLKNKRPDLYRDRQEVAHEGLGNLMNLLGNYRGKSVKD